MSSDGELEALQLLRELQCCLADILNSLGGKSGSDLRDHFVFYTSVYLNRAAEGFIALREAGRPDASKLLVRPALEAMFRQHAVINRPELLYRMAFTERKEERKLLRPVYARANKDYDSLDEQQWRKFSTKYRNQFPTHVLEDKPLTLYDYRNGSQYGRLLRFLLSPVLSRHP